MRTLTGFGKMELVYRGSHINTYLAMDDATGKSVWVKRPISAYPSATDVEKLQWESDISARLASRGFPHFVAPFRKEIGLISVAENRHAQGLTLRRRMDSLAKPIPVEDVLKTGLAVIKMLEAFHRLRLVLNHLHPESLWLDPSTFT